VADLVDADPAAAVIAYLSGHPAVTEALGGSDRISADNEPPYPHLGVLDTPGGSDRDMVWLIAPEVTLQLWGDKDGTPGKAVLRGVFFTILQALRDLPNQPTEPGQPVITAVGNSGAGGWSPEPDNQPRYLARRQIFLHPPQSEPAP
jgi:hypothetical protein